MEKITKREMFVALKALAEAEDLHIVDVDERISNEAVVEFCEKEIAALDKKAAKAKEKAAEKKAAGDALADVVFEVLSEVDFEPISEIASRIEGEDVTASKVTYRLTQFYKAGKIEKQEIEIGGEDGAKKRKVMGYRKITQ